MPRATWQVLIYLFEARWILRIHLGLRGRPPPGGRYRRRTGQNYHSPAHKVQRFVSATWAQIQLAWTYLGVRQRQLQRSYLSGRLHLGHPQALLYPGDGEGQESLHEQLPPATNLWTGFRAHGQHNVPLPVDGRSISWHQDATRPSIRGQSPRIPISQPYKTWPKVFSSSIQLHQHNTTL